MSITRLEMTHFRNFTSAGIEPIPNGFNLIYGNNGSGKTSILEAIYFLSLGRSFRASLSERIINNEAEKFSIFASISNDHGQSIPLGIEKERNKSSKIRLDGKDKNSISELTQLMPIRIINSQAYALIEGGPIFRRKYLDWGIFYQKNDFLSLWQRFERALKQRNAALKNKLSKSEVEIWTRELIITSFLFDQMRQEYISQLTPILLQVLPLIFEDHFDVKIEYQKGWDQGSELADVFSHSYLKDSYLGYTQFGPHKADLKVLINDVAAKDFLSRGQQKLFVCAMILAQGKLLSTTQKKPIFLVDDLPSELDRNSLSKVIKLMGDEEAQVFVTAIEGDAIKEFSKRPIKLFHVEQANILRGFSEM